MKLVWLVLLILCFKESQSTVRTFYPSTGSGLSFLCGCASEKQYNKNTKITCKNGQVIQMEPSGYLMRNSSDDYKYCGNLNYTTCRIFKPTVLGLEDRIEVYKQCSNQNSCDIKIAEPQGGKDRLVNYPFYCQSVHDLSVKVAESNNPILYFTGEKYNGKKYTGQKIDCDCSVTSSAPIRLEIFFINLKPHTCSTVKFLSETHQLFGCTARGITLLYISSVYIGREFKLEMRGMKPDEEDVLYFQVLGSDLTVDCGGCRNSTDGWFPTTSKSSIDTTADLSTTTALASSDPDSSTIDITTTVNPSQEGLSASTDQTSNVSTTVLGGILAAVIIINIVCITLCCFIRRRRKQQKSRHTLANTSGNGVTHRPSSTNSNVDQNGDQGISSDSIESISKTSGSKDRPNNQYHVLEVDTYSEPANAGAKQKRERKQDDYDHINDGSKSKPINNDTYNHIDSTLNTTSLSDDYNHIEDQNGLSNGKLELIDFAKNKQKRKPKNQVSGQENTSYVNVNLEPDEAPPNSEDVDTYNHLQN